MKQPRGYQAADRALRRMRKHVSNAGLKLYDATAEYLNALDVAGLGPA